MEKQKPFTLFVPPRLSSSQVSAVKPQTAGGDSNYFKVSLRGSFEKVPGGGGTAWGKALAATPEDPSSIPRTREVRGEEQPSSVF